MPTESQPKWAIFIKYRNKKLEVFASVICMYISVVQNLVSLKFTVVLVMIINWSIKIHFSPMHKVIFNDLFNHNHSL